MSQKNFFWRGLLWPIGLCKRGLLLLKIEDDHVSIAQGCQMRIDESLFGIEITLRSRTWLRVGYVSGGD